MKMWWTYLCSLVALTPTAVSTEVRSAHVVAPSSATAPLGIEAPREYALKGGKGGLQILHSDEPSGNDEHYRTWEHRFELQPYNLDSARFLKSENRIGYRQFAVASPLSPLVPNSRDREAEASTELMFGMTALGTVVCGLLIINGPIQGMQLLDTSNLDMERYQQLMIRVVAFASLPWLLLGAWLVTIFINGVLNPMRDPHMAYQWQCNSMAWFLLIVPILNTAYFTSHALWISQLFFKIEMQPNGAMGRMFMPSIEKQADDTVSFIVNMMTSSTTRHTLLFMEVVCVLFGYTLITFRSGANSQLCQPEVYWATNALVIAVAIVIVFTSLTFICSVLVGVYSTAPWVQDFFGSFFESRILSKMKKEETEEALAWKAQQAADEEASQFDEIDDWDDFEQSFEEDRQRHEAIMAEHEKYMDAVSGPAPERPQDKPLVVWDDDEEEESHVPQRISGSRPVVISSSLAAVNAQIDVNHGPKWTSQGFASPFAQRPNSSPVITTSQPLVVGSNQFMTPASASTLYTTQTPLLQ